MKKQQLTNWFPGHVKPYRIGRYELADLGEIWDGWWDGNLWRPHQFAAPYMFQDRPWRGLAHQPK